MVTATSISEPNRKSYRSSAEIVFRYAVMSVMILSGSPGRIYPKMELVISSMMTWSTFTTKINTQMFDE